MTIHMKQNLTCIIMGSIIIFGLLSLLVVLDSITIKQEEVPVKTEIKIDHAPIIQQKLINIDKTSIDVQEDLEEIKTTIRRHRGK